MRALLAGLSLLALSTSLAACAPEAPKPVAPTNTTPVAKMPVEIESKFAQNGDVKIHYVASGQGPLVVMIHGFPDFSGTWDELTPKLNDAYRVVAMDTRGYNLSSQPEGVANYSMDKLVADVQAVIDAEGAKKATVIGHDWGAAIAWNYAFSHPEVLERLVIMSVPHPANMGRQLQASPQSSNYARNFQKEGSEKNLTADGLASMVSGSHPELKAKYAEAFGKSSFAAMMNYYRANYPVGDNAPKPGAKPPVYPMIDVPVLVVHGMKDTALLAMGHNDTWDHVTKDTTVVMIPTAGHFIQHDAPDLLAAEIRSWLDIHPVPAPPKPEPAKDAPAPAKPQ